MTFPIAAKLLFSVHEKKAFRIPHILRLCSSLPKTTEEAKEIPQRKLLKVAFLGRPNVGKSTLINKILNLNLCGASHKFHTTKTPFRAVFTEGDTQVVFLDTPGLITRKELSRFQLPKDFNRAWEEKFICDVDVLGVVHEVKEAHDIFKYSPALVSSVQNLPKTKPLFLVINKVDLVLNKKALQNNITTAIELMSSENVSSEKKPTIWSNFSKIFFTSAVKDKGVSELANYLLEQARPGKWLFEPGQFFDKPLNEVVLQLLRAQVMEFFPHEVPYLCNYEIEYLKENDLGEIVCVALIICKLKKHLIMFTVKKKSYLRTLCKKLESDLYKILRKVFRIRVVVVGPNK